ncbi:alpha/beta fold hydrolase [Nocardia bovistercoris]|uniref:Alpha/beta fold hydrolase n=1 Tax=Nocardia bovistercoris TaxID=2785916 RepID=A0A931N629_9NOCA|nr:alpha/beta fold hydrolase [Nocardia bovistercoris]MBH0780514.1 alpha/beta fold hydrolase [Nocardia bovistercoris]
MATVSPGRAVFDLDSVTLHALTWGERGAPLALCLHGYPDTAWTWRYLGPVLADRGYYVVAPFTRGYAPSSLPADGNLSVGSRVADAIDIAARVDAPEAVIIGHDWGAFSANAAAAMPDSPFRSMVGMAVPPLTAVTFTRENFLRQVSRAAAQSVNSWYILANQLPALPERFFTPQTALLWRRWSPGYDAAEDLAHLAESAPTAQHRSAIIGYYRQLVRPRSQSTRDRELDKLLTAPPLRPILQLYGTTDGCLRPEFFHGLERRLPAGSRVVGIENAGHFLHLEKPDAVHEAIIAHLESEAPVTEDGS